MPVLTPDSTVAGAGTDSGSKDRGDTGTGDAAKPGEGARPPEGTTPPPPPPAK